MVWKVSLVLLICIGVLLAEEPVPREEVETEYNPENYEPPFPDDTQHEAEVLDVKQYPDEEAVEFLEAAEAPVEVEVESPYEEVVESPDVVEVPDNVEVMVEDEVFEKPEEEEEFEFLQEQLNDETELVVDLLSQNILPERFKSEGFFNTWNLDIKSRLQEFRWRDCGGEAAHIVSMSVSPDPIKLPGTMNIAVLANVISSLTSPLQTNLTIEKKLIGKWVKIPCIGEFGSCMYDDLCDILYSASCPEVLTEHGIPCACPFNAKNYTLPLSSFDAESLYFPGGDYHVIGELHQNGKFLACLELYLSLTSS